MNIPIKINSDNCRGCRRCEMACSWQENGMINPKNAGIKIHILDEVGKHLPVLNQQCYEAFCGKEPKEVAGQGIPSCVFACAFDALTMGNTDDNQNESIENEGGMNHA